MSTLRSPGRIVRAVWFALMLREIRGKFGANRLGAFWFFFEPLGQLLLLLAVFSAIRAPVVNGVPLILFLVNGIIAFVLFKNISLTGMQAVNANKGLFAYRQIQAIDMVGSRILVEVALMGAIYVVTLIALSLWGDVDVAMPDPLLWFLALLIGISLSGALALIFCVFIAYFPELATVIRMAYFPLYFISGIVFPIASLPQDMVSYLMWNPYLHIVEVMRYSSISNYHALANASLSYASGVALVFVFLAMATYRITKRKLVAA